MIPSRGLSSGYSGGYTVCIPHLGSSCWAELPKLPKAAAFLPRQSILKDQSFSYEPPKVSAVLPLELG